jgi:hypothetical protein
LTVPSPGSASIVEKNAAIEQVIAEMKAANYPATGLDMRAKRGDDLTFWNVAQGVLIVSYSTTTQKVARVTFFLCDERANARTSRWLVIRVGSPSDSLRRRVNCWFKPSECSSRQIQPTRLFALVAGTERKKPPAV